MACWFLNSHRKTFSCSVQLILLSGFQMRSPRLENKSYRIILSQFRSRTPLLSSVDTWMINWISLWWILIVERGWSGGVIGWRRVAMVAWWCWVGGGVVLLVFFLLLHFSSTNGLLWPLGKRGSLTSERQKNNKLLLYKAIVMYLPY